MWWYVGASSWKHSSMQGFVVVLTALLVCREAGRTINFAFVYVHRLNCCQLLMCWSFNNNPLFSQPLSPTEMFICIRKMEMTTTTLELCKYTAMALGSTFATLRVSTRKLPMPFADSWALRKLWSLGAQVKEETTPSKKIEKLMTPNLHLCFKAQAYVLLLYLCIIAVIRQSLIRSLVLQM